MTSLFQQIRNFFKAPNKQKVTQPQRPHHGLYNQGATCYLNSVLQVLFMTPEIHDRLDPNSQTTDRELRNIFEKMKETTCGTENITKSLEIKNVSKQLDAAECLGLILRMISPQACEVFQGELKHTTKCCRGHRINEMTKPFKSLPLSLNDTLDTGDSVESSFQQIFKSFSGENELPCNKCKKKTEATSGCEMVKYPQILTLLLKRFYFDNNTMSRVKSDRCVDVPCELQIKNKTYKLYGMVNHMGGLVRGHYTATILSNEDKTWYEFHDDRVNKVEEQPFAETGTYKSETAYLLLYRVTQPQRHYGLNNQGATCYLNSVLQVLSMTPEIHDRLDAELRADVQLKIIFEDLKKKTCGTETITATFGIKNVNVECDAAECLEIILDRISLQASEVFQGELTYTTKCSKGHTINEETNPFRTLPLSLSDTHDATYSVESSFERTFEPKSFSGENKVYCDKCNKKTKTTSGCEMVKYPQILTLLLKRFYFDNTTMSHVKSDRCVDVPCELQIENKTYKLYGMVNHMGSLGGGHYTATILSNEDKTWYEFDDNRVNKVGEQPFAETAKYKSETAYLLLYRESQKSSETKLQGLIDNAKEDDTSKLDDPKQDVVEQKKKVAECDTDV